MKPEATIFELISSLEDAVLMVAKNENLGMAHRVKTMLVYTCDTAEAMRMAAAHVNHMPPGQLMEFNQARDRLLLYLVYFARLQKYFFSGTGETTDTRAQFPMADFFDWRQAETDAARLYKQFQDTEGQIPLPDKLVSTP